MTAIVIDPEGTIVRTVYNVRGVEQRNTRLVLLMEFTDKAVPLSEDFRVQLSPETK
jgi:hypothetical protein